MFLHIFYPVHIVLYVDSLRITRIQYISFGDRKCDIFRRAYLGEAAQTNFKRLDILKVSTGRSERLNTNILVPVVFLTKFNLFRPFLAHNKFQQSSSISLTDDTFFNLVQNQV